MSITKPGLIALLGSGETLPSSGKTHEYLAKALPENPKISILETPAGFELNADRVAGKIGEFLEVRLQNYARRSPRFRHARRAPHTARMTPSWLPPH